MSATERAPTTAPLPNNVCAPSVPEVPALITWRHFQSWGGITQESPEPREQRRERPQAHPASYVEKRLVIEGIDCTALWHQAAREEIARLTRHLTPAQQRVAKALVSDCTVGGHYYWSQKRLGLRAAVSRQKTNTALRRLSGDLEILHKPEKQRHYNAPKTLTLARWVLDRIFRAVKRALSRLQGDTRKAKPSVESFPGRALPSLREILPRFRRRRRYSGGWMVSCPAHDDHTPSLSVSEGQSGKLLLHCHAGCSHAQVRAALGLPAPKRASEPKMTLRAPGPVLEPRAPGLAFNYATENWGPIPWDLPAKSVTRPTGSDVFPRTQSTLGLPDPPLSHRTSTSEEEIHRERQPHH